MKEIEVLLFTKPAFLQYERGRAPLSLLKSSRALVVVVGVMIILVLAVFNFGSWIFINRIENSLEAELEKRLQGLARMGAELVESGEFVQYLSLGQKFSAGLLLAPALAPLREEIEVQQIFLIDRGLRVLASSNEELFSLERELVHLREDSAALAAAWSGTVTASALRVIGAARFKTAFAPVRGPNGQVLCLFVVEANADFFNLLRNFRNGLVLGGIVSFVVLIIFGFFLVSVIGLFLRTQENLRRSERLALMGQMSATVAHEIRNPLSIIKNTAEVLRQKYGDQQSPDELFEFIPDEVRRLNRLMNDFLSFARDRELARKPGDLIKTVGRAINLMRNEDHGRGVEWRLHGNREEITAEYDEDALTQVLMNLFLNASQAMNGAGKVEVQIEARAKGRDGIHLRIRDHGPGLPDSSEKIFEPFFTTKSRGSGLGLPVCKQLIEKHNGRITAESKPNEGTTIHIWLPA
jgi:signal transduction histidine kinase